MNKYIKGSPQPIIDWLYKKGYTYAIDRDWETIL